MPDGSIICNEEDLEDALNWIKGTLEQTKLVNGEQNEKINI